MLIITSRITFVANEEAIGKIKLGLESGITALVGPDNVLFKKGAVGRTITVECTIKAKASKDNDKIFLNANIHRVLDIQLPAEGETFDDVPDADAVITQTKRTGDIIDLNERRAGRM